MPSTGTLLSSVGIVNGIVMITCLVIASHPRFVTGSIEQPAESVQRLCRSRMAPRLWPTRSTRSVRRRARPPMTRSR